MFREKKNPANLHRSDVNKETTELPTALFGCRLSDLKYLVAVWQNICSRLVNWQEQTLNC